MINYLARLESILECSLTDFNLDSLYDKFRWCNDFSIVLGLPYMFAHEEHQSQLLVIKSVWQYSEPLLDYLVTLVLAWYADYNGCLTNMIGRKDLNGHKIVDPISHIDGYCAKIAAFIQANDLAAVPTKSLVGTTATNLHKYLALAVRTNNLAAVRWLVALTPLDTIVTVKCDQDPVASPEVNRAFLNNLVMLAFQQGYHDIVNVLVTDGNFQALNRADNLVSFDLLEAEYRQHVVAEITKLETYKGQLSLIKA